MTAKKYHLEYIDYDPDLCKEYYFDTEEEAYQCLVEQAIDELRDMEYDEESPATKKVIRTIRKGKGAKAMLTALNDWFKDCHIFVSYKLTREDPEPFPYDPEGNIKRLEEALAHRKKQQEEYWAKHAKS